MAKLLVFCGLFLSVVSMNAQAQEHRAFVITPYYLDSDANAKLLRDEVNFESRVHGYGLGVSYDPVKWAGLELRYTSREDLDFIREFDGDFDIISWDLSGHLRHHFNRVLYVQGVVGYSVWEAEGFTDDDVIIDDLGDVLLAFTFPWLLESQPGGVQFESDGEDFFYGAGIGVSFSSRAEMFLNYEILDTNAIELETLALGVNIRF